MIARTLMLMAGGTGGHIFPALAVADVLREQGHAVSWLGANGAMETRLVPARGIAIDTLSISALRGKGLLALLLAPLRLCRAVAQAIAVLRRRRPEAVLAFGGFAAAPGGIAAALLGVPLLVHEQNQAPGMTNRLLARFARRVLCGFPGAFSRGEWVGNPVRPQIAAIPPPAERLAGRQGAVRVLVLGGSQGARALNEAVPKALRDLPMLEVRHQCGAAMVDATRAAYAQAGRVAQVEPFIEDMAAAYDWADVVIARAGASTLAEVCAAGIACVLVPFPGAVDDHQAANAEVLAAAGAALWLRQSPDWEAELARMLALLLPDRRTLLRMAEAARGLAHPDAAARVAAIALVEIERRGRAA